MRGLRKYLTPFAPDQSGAASVLYELGGLLVICDAGGCTGNICGFDEPRWHTVRSAVFSAGLRDMDAILGRDDKLVGELCDAAERLEPAFAAIIGTPVPSVIGTDYAALRRMSEKRTGLPVLTVDTTGMESYDKGAEKAYLELFDRFAVERLTAAQGRTGVIGVNPLDMGDLRAAERIRRKIPGAICYGMDSTLSDIQTASAAERNIVCAPSGLRAARLLQKRFGTPYEIFDPLAADLVPALEYTGKRVLVIDQQVRAITMRTEILERGAASVTCATWFMQFDELARPGDTRLMEEDDLAALVGTGDFDILIGDPTQWRIVKDFDGVTADVPQFPVSGRLVGE